MWPPGCEKPRSERSSNWPGVTQPGSGAAGIRTHLSCTPGDPPRRTPQMWTRSCQDPKPALPWVSETGPEPGTLRTPQPPMSASFHPLSPVPPSPVPPRSPPTGQMCSAPKDVSETQGRAAARRALDASVTRSSPRPRVARPLQERDPVALRGPGMAGCHPAGAKLRAGATERF